ncbi:MAG: helix-turn-helix domain-containing protein [Chloroflexi bacterium]|nr:helix-turn-helix domain-containing protein [Chloroflexota bacterium]
MAKDSTPNNRETLMTVRDVAKYLKVSPATVYKLVKEEKIPCHHIGRLWRFKRVEIDEWLVERQPLITKADQ